MKAGFLKGNIEWRLIAPRLALFLVMSAAFLGGSLFLWSEAVALQELVAANRRDLAHLKGEIREKSDSLRLAERYQAAYRRLRKRHLVDGIDRLQLIEAINGTRQELAIPEMLYRFDPENVADDYFGLSPRLHRFHVTNHFLEFSLRDETELLHVMQRLRDPLLGFHVVEACEMKRRSEELHLNGGGNVKGKCRFVWLTLRARGEEEPAEADGEAAGGGAYGF